jgi:hypothetical protein
MQRSGAIEATANLLRKFFPVVLLLCLAVSGCGTTCVSGFWNGSTSGVAASNSSCPLPKAMGAVIVQINAVAAPTTVSASFPAPLASPYNVQHIFVTIRSIEAHPDMQADEDSPAWQELAPDLSAHPVQVDLLVPSARLTPAGSLMMNGDSGSLSLPADAISPATVTADEYSQLRLQLLPRTPVPDGPVPETNACGSVGWNCIVFADHSARPLEFPSSEFAVPTRSGQSGFDSAPEFRITVEHGSAGLFRILPGEVLHLSIEFDAASFVFFTSDAAVHLVPVFRVVSRRSLPSP